MIKIIDNTTNKNIAYESFSFSGGERHMQLNPPINSGTDLVIDAYIYNSDELMTLFLLLNACCPADQITLKLKYMPYARQDRYCSPGQAHSFYVFAQFLSNFRNLYKVVTYDIHSKAAFETLQSCLGKNVKVMNISMKDIIFDYTNLSDIIIENDMVIVVPDKGAVDRCHYIYNKLQDTNNSKYTGGIIYLDKDRDSSTGRINGMKISHTQHIMNSDIQGRKCIILDDICDGGYTFKLASDILNEKGAADVNLYVTHGIFSKGLEAMPDINHFYTTDSIKSNIIKSDKITYFNT